jgi:hypothetical protein
MGQAYLKTFNQPTESVNSMKGKKLFLTSWPHGKLVQVEVIERKKNLQDGWYIRYATGGTDTTTSDFLFDAPEDMQNRIDELELQIKQKFEHKKCEIERLCSSCNKAFILEDVQHNPNVQASISNFENCPHCHARNDTWVKISWLSK